MSHHRQSVKVKVRESRKLPTSLDSKSDTALAKNKGNPPQAAQQPTPPTQDELDEDVEMDQSDAESEPEKDAKELELERLIFGDTIGFKEGLRDFAQTDAAPSDDDDDGDALEGLDDSALFFTDSGVAPTTNVDSDSEPEARLAAAWHDSDDERTLISLASAPRLRKLRRTEAEDIVDGREYAKRLRRQYELLNPRPEWAEQGPAKKQRRMDDSDADSDSDDDTPTDVAPLERLMRESGSLARSNTTSTSKKRKLRPEVLSIQRLPDLPLTQPSAITSLTFHPTLPLLLSSGPSGTLYLHHLTPATPLHPTANPLLTSLHLKRTPLTTTAFHPTSPRIFLSARRRYFHTWNLLSGHFEKISRIYNQAHTQRSMETFKLSPCGTSMALLGSSRKGGGVLNILSASTLQWTAQVRVESRSGIADFAWYRDGSGLAILAKNGEVTEYSALTDTVTARWQDEGAVGSTVLALGGQHPQKSPLGPDRWIAVGSSSGIVNLYDRLSFPSPIVSELKTPKPAKTFDQLTTPTSHLVFSGDGQVLVLASKWKRDALRVVHLPSATVFRNWPTGETPLGRVSGVAVRMGGEGEEVYATLAVANEGGKVRLFEIR